MDVFQADSELSTVKATSFTPSPWRSMWAPISVDWVSGDVITKVIWFKQQKKKLS